MYFWKANQLVEDFREERVTQKEEFKYMVASAILTLLMVELTSFSADIDPETSYGMKEFLTAIIFILLCVGGTFYCFRINEQGDNKNFLTRFVCLGWTTSVKFFVISIPVITVSSFVAFFAIEMAGITSEETFLSIFEVLFLFVLVAYYFLYFGYLGKKIKAVSELSGVPV